ncbi:MAG: NAD(P)H-hydrate dehydratase [Lachnospiraceae bacterium]
MEAILSAEEMKYCDNYTSEYFGMQPLVLMERAALGVFDTLNEEKVPLFKVLVVCGSGNNGGDGFAIARLLKEKQIPVEVVFAGTDDSCTPETKVQWEIAFRYGVVINRTIEENAYTTVIDALFGIGLNRELSSSYQEVINAINRFKDRGAVTVSVDIASGIAADTGAVMGAAVKADLTVTFAYKKIGHLLYPGAAHTGKLIKKDIGITPASFRETVPKTFALEASDLVFAKRPAYSNKGTFGKALIIAGSEAMAGAAVLASKACLKSGCGMVQVFTHEKNRQVLIESLPEAIVTVYGKEIDSPLLYKAMEWADIIGIGPGISLGLSAETLLREVLLQTGKPLVIDADAISLLSGQKRLLHAKQNRTIIMTPHIGEYCRFMQLEKSEVINDLIGAARKLSEEYGVICACKDARTVTAEPSGLCRINSNGNSGMASAGTGDVLFGIICSLLAQGMQPFDAASYGVYLHGAAGDLASLRCGERGMLASDLIDAMREYLQ